MSEKTQLEELMQNEYELAKRWIETQKKEIMNHFIAIMCRNGTEEGAYVAAPWNNYAERTACLEMMRLLFKKKNVVRYIMCSEAWFTEYEPDKPFVMPSKSTHKQECLMIIGADKETGERLCRTFPITRDNAGRRSVDQEIADDKEDVRGEAFNLFDERPLHS